MFRRALCTVATLVAFGGYASAADIYTAPEPVPEATPVIPTFTWSGPYIGIQGGGGWADGDFSGAAVSGSSSFDGGLLGAFVGYNHQLDNNIVIGIEGDIYYNWNDDNFTGVREAGTDAAGSVRGRVGYAFDRALIYATAGWTATRGYIDVPPKDSATFNGWTVGAGFDYAFTDNVFGRAEYRYNDYGDKNLGGTNFDLNQHTVTVGIGVKF